MERFNREVHFENFEDDKFALGRTIAHEIGHSFGLSHNKEQSGCIEVDNDVQPILMDGGGLSNINNRFANFNINLLRSRITSPGE